ncbi:MAG: hypothetical protein ABIC95_03510 [archaeon]
MARAKKPDLKTFPTKVVGLLALLRAALNIVHEAKKTEAERELTAQAIAATQSIKSLEVVMKERERKVQIAKEKEVTRLELLEIETVKSWKIIETLTEIAPDQAGGRNEGTDSRARTLSRLLLPLAHGVADPDKIDIKVTKWVKNTIHAFSYGQGRGLLVAFLGADNKDIDKKVIDLLDLCAIRLDRLDDVQLKIAGDIADDMIKGLSQWTDRLNMTRALLATIAKDAGVENVPEGELQNMRTELVMRRVFIYIRGIIGKKKGDIKALSDLSDYPGLKTFWKSQNINLASKDDIEKLSDGQWLKIQDAIVKNTGRLRISPWKGKQNDAMPAEIAFVSGYILFSIKEEVLETWKTTEDDTGKKASLINEYEGQTVIDAFQALQKAEMKTPAQWADTHAVLEAVEKVKQRIELEKQGLEGKNGQMPLELDATWFDKIISMYGAQYADAMQVDKLMHALNETPVSMEHWSERVEYWLRAIRKGKFFKQETLFGILALLEKSKTNFKNLAGFVENPKNPFPKDLYVYMKKHIFVEWAHIKPRVERLHDLERDHAILELSAIFRYRDDFLDETTKGIISALQHRKEHLGKIDELLKTINASLPKETLFPHRGDQSDFQEMVDTISRIREQEADHGPLDMTFGRLAQGGTLDARERQIAEAFGRDGQALMSMVRHLHEYVEKTVKSVEDTGKIITHMIDKTGTSILTINHIETFKLSIFKYHAQSQKDEEHTYHPETARLLKQEAGRVHHDYTQLKAVLQEEGQQIGPVISQCDHIREVERIERDIHWITFTQGMITRITTELERISEEDDSITLPEMVARRVLLLDLGLAPRINHIQNNLMKLIPVIPPAVSDRFKHLSFQQLQAYAASLGGEPAIITLQSGEFQAMVSDLDHDTKELRGGLELLSEALTEARSKMVEQTNALSWARLMDAVGDLQFVDKKYAGVKIKDPAVWIRSRLNEKELSGPELRKELENKEVLVKGISLVTHARGLLENDETLDSQIENHLLKIVEVERIFGFLSRSFPKEYPLPMHGWDKEFEIADGFPKPADETKMPFIHFKNDRKMHAQVVVTECVLPSIWQHGKVVHKAVVHTRTAVHLTDLRHEMAESAAKHMQTLRADEEKEHERGWESERSFGDAIDALELLRADSPEGASSSARDIWRQITLQLDSWLPGLHHIPITEETADLMKPAILKVVQDLEAAHKEWE